MSLVITFSIIYEINNICETKYIMDDHKVLKMLISTNNKIKSMYKHIINKNEKLLQYLNNRYLDSESLEETVYRIHHNIEIRPTCKNCEGHVNFIPGIGFRECCSVSCSKHLRKIIHIECSDEIIINEYKETGPRNKTSDKFLLEHGYKEYLLNRYNDSYSITETIYRIINNIEQKPICKICGKPVRLISYEKGFDEVCSDMCMRRNEIKLSDINDEYIKQLSDTAAYKEEYRGYNTLLQYCKNKFGVKFRSYQEAMYLIRHEMDEPPKCPICGKYLEYHRLRYNKKYNEYCSDKCRAKAKRISWKDRLIEETGYDITLDDDLNFVFHNVCDKHEYFTLTSLMAHNRCMASRIDHMVLCPICNPERNPESSIETIVKNILDSENISYIQHSRDIISPKELDFYLPDYNIAIECNGMYWHSDQKKNEDYHSNKLNICNDKGIQMLTFWEYDIIHYPEKVKHIILSLTNHNKNINADKCIIKEIDTFIANKFLDMYDLQEHINAKVKLGLYYNNELVQVMVLGKLKNNVKFKVNSNDYELYRICTKFGYNIINGTELLLSYFKNNYTYSKIIVNINKDLYNKNNYEYLGFILDTETNSDYFYYNYKEDTVKTKHSLRKVNKNIYLKCLTSGIKKYILYNTNDVTV